LDKVGMVVDMVAVVVVLETMLNNQHIHFLLENTILLLEVFQLLHNVFLEVKTLLFLILVDLLF
jgi:hypothetical protein